MQSISEGSEEQCTPAASKRQLKDASTNTNGDISGKGVTTAHSIGTSTSPLSPKTFYNSPSRYTSPEYQSSHLFKQNFNPDLAVNPCIEKESNCNQQPRSLHPDYLHPIWNPGEICYKRNILKRSPVAYNIKVLNNDAIRTQNSTAPSNNYGSPSNIVYIPVQAPFHHEREFRNIYYGGFPRSNLESRLSSSEGSLASSSISKGDARYIRPQSRVLDHLDLQTVFCDPVVHHGSRYGSKETEERYISR